MADIKHEKHSEAVKHDSGDEQGDTSQLPIVNSVYSKNFSVVSPRELFCSFRAECK